MNHKSFTWYELLDQLIGGAGLSRPQVARRAGVKTKTITSWLRGDVASPRNWRLLAQVLRALSATAAEADHVLQGAGHPPLRQLAARGSDQDRGLLDVWLRLHAPFMAPDRLARTLIGRQAELTQATDNLRWQRRCVLLGMAGIGKSTLAVELAHQLQPNYPDGVFWGNLRTGNAEAILESWGQACGVAMERLVDFQSRAATMRAVFSRKQALIVLDDVIDSQLALQMIPSQNLGCSVLITTRHEDVAHSLTRMQSDLQVRLLPMDRQHSLAVLASVLGEDLIAGAVAAADQIAALLGDMPLALHICAALCVDVGVSLAQAVALLEDMRNRLEYLQLEDRPLVRLAFEQSWVLLDEQTQRGLATLGVFAGRPFNAPAFAASADLSEPVAALLLTRLCRRSLLTRIKTFDAGNNTTQYQQHTLLAAFAMEKLTDDDPGHRRFSGYYGWLVSQPGWQHTGEREIWGNVMAGMSTAHRLQAWPLLLSYTAHLTEAWRRQGLYSLARQGLRWTLDAARETADAQAEAQIRLEWGCAGLEQSDYPLARAQLTESLTLFTAQREMAGVAAAHYHLSRVEMEQSNYAAAEEAIRLAYQAYQQAEDVIGMGRALYRLGYVVYFRGDNERAANLAADAIRSQEQVGDKLGLVRSHRLATQALILLGQINQAEQHCRAAAQLVEEVDDLAEMAAFYYTYADLLRQQHSFANSRTYALQALALFRQMADSSSEVNALLLLAGIEVFWNEAEPGRQQFDEGLAYCRDGLALSELVGYAVGKAFLLLMNGRLLAQQGHAAAACDTWRQALQQARALQHTWLQQRLQTLIDEMPCASNEVPPPIPPQAPSPAL